MKKYLIEVKKDESYIIGETTLNKDELKKILRDDSKLIKFEEIK